MIYRTHDTLSTLNILRSSTRINIYMLTYCCSKACLYRLVTLDVNFSCLIRVDFLTSFSTCNHEHIVCILQRGASSTVAADNFLLWLPSLQSEMDKTQLDLQSTDNPEILLLLLQPLFSQKIRDMSYCVLDIILPSLLCSLQR